MIKKKINITIMIFILTLALSLVSLSKAQDSPLSLEKGKNNVTFDKIGKIITAKELVSLNPEIETISYFDENLQISVGFVNAFGGLGKNFIIDSGTPYEINVKKEITLLLP